MPDHYKCKTCGAEHKSEDHDSEKKPRSLEELKEMAQKGELEELSKQEKERLEKFKALMEEEAGKKAGEEAAEATKEERESIMKKLEKREVDDELRKIEEAN